MTDREAAARDWLSRNDFRRNEIRALRLQLEEMRASVSKTTATIQEVKVQTQPRNAQDEKIADIVEFEKKIKEKEKILEALDETTIRTIERMKDPTRKIILLYRHIYMRGWGYIAEKLHYTTSYCHAIYYKALDGIYPLIEWSAE